MNTNPTQQIEAAAHVAAIEIMGIGPIDTHAQIKRHLLRFASQLMQTGAMKGVSEALEWINETVPDAISPFEGVTHHDHPQWSEWMCRGCSGVFTSHWPAWEKPTDDSFPHKPECKYTATKRALASISALKGLGDSQ